MHINCTSTPDATDTLALLIRSRMKAGLVQGALTWESNFASRRSWRRS